MKYRFLKFYLEPDGGQGGEGEQPGGGNQQPQPPAQPVVDYEKLASLIAGKQSVTEDTILKNYFKQQGLSQEEAQSAISAFKEQKAKNTPDVSAMQQQLAQANAAAQQALVEKSATMTAIELGIDAKTIPYVLKMADLSSVIDKEGKVNDEAVKTAINKVLEDVPMLKVAETQSTGFKIGAAGTDGQQNVTQPKNNTNTTPAKRWNRFNS